VRRTIKSLQGTRALTTKAWLWGEGGWGGSALEGMGALSGDTFDQINVLLR